MNCMLTEPDVAVATVVFVASTPETDAIVRGEITHFGGRVRRTARDGVMVTFDAPSRAIRCMQRLRSLVPGLRAGMHAGQLTMHGRDVEGAAVQIAANVFEATREGGVLVSRTVAELAAGSGIDLVERHTLGGLQLFGVP